MKIAIIGSRSFTDYIRLEAEVEQLEVALATKITGIVSGGSKGIDALAEAFGREHNIPMQIIRPDYATYGRRAPLVRNKEIVKVADVVLAIWNGQSRGTAHALKMARELGVKTIVVIPQAELRTGRSASRHHVLLPRASACRPAKTAPPWGGSDVLWNSVGCPYPGRMRTATLPRRAPSLLRGATGLGD